MHWSLNFISDVIFLGVYFGAEPSGCVAYIVFMLIGFWFSRAEKKVTMQNYREPVVVGYSMGEWYGSEPNLLYSDIRKLSVSSQISVTSQKTDKYESIYSGKEVFHSVCTQDGYEHIACPELDHLDADLLECIVPAEIRGQIDCCNINQHGVCAIESFSLREIKEKSDRYREWQRREFMATVLLGRIERVIMEIESDRNGVEVSERGRSSCVDNREKAREKIFLVNKNNYAGLGIGNAWSVDVPKMIIQLAIAGSSGEDVGYGAFFFAYYMEVIDFAKAGWLYYQSQIWGWSVHAENRSDTSKIQPVLEAGTVVTREPEPTYESGPNRVDQDGNPTAFDPLAAASSFGPLAIFCFVACCV